MSEHLLAALWVGLGYLVHLAFVARALLRPHREPTSRVAWVVVIMVLPVAGIVAYILLGETDIGRRRVARMRQVLERLPSLEKVPGAQAPNVLPHFPERYAPRV